MSTTTAQSTSTSHSATPMANRISIVLLIICAFVAITTEYVVIGILPQLASGLDVSTAQAGQLVSLFAFTVMIFGPFLTALFASKKRKPLFIILLVIYALSNALAAMAPNYTVMAIARIISALALPVFWGTASETAVQLAPPEHAGRTAAQFYLGSASALLIGLPFGTLIASHLGWRVIFIVLALFSLAMAVAIKKYMPAIEKPLKLRFREQAGILKSRYFLTNLLLSVVVFCAMFAAYTYLSDILESIVEVPTANVGWWFLAFGAIGLVGNWLGGKFLDRSLLRTTMFFLVALGIGMVGTTLFAGITVLLWVFLAVWAIAYTALFPVCQVRVTHSARKAKALAGTMNVSATNGGTALGSIVGSGIIAQWGIGVIGIAAALIAFAGALITYQVIRMKRRRAFALVRP